MATDDREKQFERALARHWTNASPDSACPDAEILAAYHERTLSLEEMAHWKEHITSCTRCQEILALVEQTETIPAEDWKRQAVADTLPAAFQTVAGASLRSLGNPKESALPEVILTTSDISESRSVRHRPAWRWIAPLGAIAAAVMIWIGVREIRLQNLEQGRVTDLSATSSRGTQEDQNSELAMQAEPPPKPQAEPRIEVPRQKAASPPVPGMAPSTPSRNSGAASRYRALEKDQAKNEVSTGLKSDSKGEITIAPNSPSSPEAAANIRELEAAASHAPAPPAPAASAGAKIAEPRKEEQKKTQATNEAIAQDQAAQLDEYSAGLKTKNALDGFSIQQLAQVDRHFILSPGVELAWRLGNAGRIERSTDHGKTWKLQDSGVTTDLTAGSATSAKNCWVIGKAGTLLLTTDGGKHWKTIHSPITDDLGGIHATDATHASIWDVPNRQSYETSDGGLTWTRVANE